MGEENRQSTRLLVDVKVDYRTEGSSFITDYSDNISRSGMFIKTSLPLQKGEKVRIRLQLPDGDAPFALDGVIKWVSTMREQETHPPGMGVQFVDNSPETSKQLDAMMEAYNKLLARQHGKNGA